MDSQLVCSREDLRSTAAMFIKGIQCHQIRDFVTRDLVVLEIKIEKGTTGRTWLYVLHTFNLEYTSPNNSGN